MSTETQGHQSLTDHLGELRTRLIYTILIILAGTAVSFTYSEQLFAIIRKPVAPYLTGGGLVYTGIADKFMAHFQISLLAGVILTAPLWLFQVWLFIAPGLYKKERRYAATFLLSGTFLFLIGVCFCYFVAYPAAFDWLFHFGGDIDKPMITIEEYLSFFTITLMMFGLIFELPLILVFLGIIGIIDQKFLREKRRYAVVILAILAAALTPTPDIFNMLVMLLPMCALYEISVFLVGWMQKSKLEASKVSTSIASKE